MDEPNSLGVTRSQSFVKTAPFAHGSMKPSLLRTCLAALALAFLAGPAIASPPKVLVVTTTLGYRHGSIELAEKVIESLGRSSGAYEVELAAVDPTKTPGDAAYGDAVRAVLARRLNPAALKQYRGIVFANTTGELPLPDKDAFIQWIRDGGAFIGVHSASDTLHDHRPYIEMLGGEFDYHREQVTVEGVNRDPAHPAVSHLGATWNLEGTKEEIYVFKNFQANAVHELLGLDRHPNSGVPGRFPIAWCREFGAGRVFYTALGHNPAVWQMEAFQKHLLGGIGWALRR
jgi:type 1 glutamine amidotransferase